MPNTPKKTCKVVLRPKTRTDKGGARIHPKGCQVRTEVKAGGTKITKNKAGQRKYKKKESRLIKSDRISCAHNVTASLCIIEMFLNRCANRLISANIRVQKWSILLRLFGL